MVASASSRQKACRRILDRLQTPEQTVTDAVEQRIAVIQAARYEHGSTEVDDMEVDLGWRHGVVVSVVRRMNEVTPRRARFVLGWVTVFGRVYHHGT